ncbi:MAG: WG repeat-containing protein [Proteobacteria bacterium]|nr:WG repeat-containing protein [Pseudomonadota bacterium]
MTPIRFCKKTHFFLLFFAILIFTPIACTSPENPAPDKPAITANDTTIDDSSTAPPITPPQTKDDKKQANLPGIAPKNAANSHKEAARFLKRAFGTAPIHINGRIVYKGMPIKIDDLVLELQDVHTTDDGQIYLIANDKYRSSALLTTEGDWLPPLEAPVEGDFEFVVINSEHFARLTFETEWSGGCSCRNPKCGARDYDNAACVNRLMNLKGQWIGSEHNSSVTLYDSPEYIKEGGPFALVKHPSRCDTEDLESYSTSCELYSIHSANRLNQVDLMACKGMSHGLFPVKTADSGGLWGYMNPLGELVIPARYEYADFFADKIALVKADGLFGYINEHGQEIVSPKFQNADRFVNGRARVRSDDLYGYIDKQGQVIVPIKFEDLSHFVNGRAAARTGSLYGYINERGHDVISPQFQWAGFDGDIAKVKLTLEHTKTLCRKAKGSAQNPDAQFLEACNEKDLFTSWLNAQKICYNFSYRSDEYCDDLYYEYGDTDEVCTPYEEVMQNAGFSRELCESCGFNGRACDRRKRAEGRVLHRGWVLIDDLGQPISRFDYHTFESFRKNGFAFVVRNDWAGYIDRQGKEYDSIDKDKDDEDEDET